MADGKRPGRESLKRPYSARVSDSESNASDEVGVDRESNNYFETLLPRNMTRGPQLHLRRQYSDLIENCQAITEKEGIEPTFKDLLTKNITEGNELFKKIGGGPGEMHMAFLHTKMYSSAILSKAEKIGTSVSGFTVESFIQALKDKGSDDGEDYSPTSLCKFIYQGVQDCHKALSPMTTLLGSFDRNSISTPPEIKEKKSRARRKKLDEPGDVTATQHEEVTIIEANRSRMDKDSPEAQSQEILRILRQNCENRKRPANIVEFTMNKQSFHAYIENLFNVSFLVRDGFVSIRRRQKQEQQGSTSDKLLDSDLVIAPEKPPKDQKDQLGSRSQHIISFNSRIYQALANACTGSALIVRSKKQDTPPFERSKRRR